MDYIEMRSELSHILAKLKAAQRSCVKHKMEIAEDLDKIVSKVEEDLVAAKKIIEESK